MNGDLIAMQIPVGAKPAIEFDGASRGLSP